MVDPRIPLQRPAPAADVETAPAGPTSAPDPGWGRVLAVSLSRSALAAVLGLLVWSVLPLAVGWTPRAIMSGSMEPRIHVGDVVVGRPVDPSKLVPGQVVTVVDPDHPAKTRTHRLLRREADGLLVLKGDANPQADSTPVRPAKVLGLGVVRVPFVARPVYWLAERAWVPLGLTLVALVALGLLASTPLRLGRPTDLDADAGTGSDDEPGDGPGASGGGPVEDADGEDAGLDILRPASTTPGRGGAPGTPRRRRAVLSVVAAGVVAGLMGVAAPAQAAYAGTTGTPLNSWSAAASFTAYRDAVLADGPLLYWRLDAATGTAVADLSGSGSSGVAGGSFTWGRAGALAAEPGNTAAGFAGGQVVQTGPTTGLSSRFTVEAWVRTTSTTGGLVVGLGDKQTSSTQDDRVLYVSPDGKARFGVGAGPARSVAASTSAVNDGRWHHLVGTVDGNGNGGGNDTATIYVDGVARGTASKAAATLTSGFWRAGSEPLAGWPGNPTTAGLTGDLDEVAVYNAPLSASRVAAHWNVGTTP